MTEQLSYCCGAELELVSPPNNVECRDCQQQYDLDDEPFDDGDVGDRDQDEEDQGDAIDTSGGDGDVQEGDDVELCGAEMSDGSLCYRSAGECPYHDQED